MHTVDWNSLKILTNKNHFFISKVDEGKVDLNGYIFWRQNDHRIFQVGSIRRWIFIYVTLKFIIILISFYRVLSGQGKPGKPGKGAIFRKSQGKPGKVREFFVKYFKSQGKFREFLSRIPLNWWFLASLWIPIFQNFFVGPNHGGSFK